MAYNKNFVISFVRHGESLGNSGLYYEDRYHKDDPPLSSLGLRQAEALGQSSITDDVDRIYSSSLVRAVATAYPTAVKLHKPIILLPDLMETGTGIISTDTEVLRLNYPLAVPCVGETSPTGGPCALRDDSFEAISLRAKRCIDFFFNTAQNGEHIMAVTHGTFSGYLMRAALGIEGEATFRWQVDNCCITRIIFTEDETPKLSFSNFTGHLDCLRNQLSD